MDNKSLKCYNKNSALGKLKRQEGFHILELNLGLQYEFTKIANICWRLYENGNVRMF